MVRPAASWLSPRHLEMGITLRQNGILSHKSLCNKEGAQDPRAYDEQGASNTHPERKIIYFFAAHIFLRIGALKATLCGPRRFLRPDSQAAEKAAISCNNRMAFEPCGSRVETGG
jgi:hypothetical protein